MSGRGVLRGRIWRQVIFKVVKVFRESGRTQYRVFTWVTSVASKLSSVMWVQLSRNIKDLYHVFYLFKSADHLMRVKAIALMDNIVQIGFCVDILNLILMQVKCVLGPVLYSSLLCFRDCCVIGACTVLETWLRSRLARHHCCIIVHYYSCFCLPEADRGCCGTLAVTSKLSKHVVCCALIEWCSSRHVAVQPCSCHESYAVSGRAFLNSGTSHTTDARSLWRSMHACMLKRNITCKDSWLIDHTIDRGLFELYRWAFDDRHISNIFAALRLRSQEGRMWDASINLFWCQWYGLWKQVGAAETDKSVPTSGSCNAIGRNYTKTSFSFFFTSGSEP